MRTDIDALQDKNNYIDYLEEYSDDEVDIATVEGAYIFENWVQAVKKYSVMLASDVYEGGDYKSTLAMHLSSNIAQPYTL